MALTDPRSAEEIRDASRVLPLGMVWSMFISIITGFVMVLTICFSVDDIESVLSSPYIQIFFNANRKPRRHHHHDPLQRRQQRRLRDGGLPFSGFLNRVKRPFFFFLLPFPPSPDPYQTLHGRDTFS